MNLKKSSADVYSTDDEIIQLDASVIELLRRDAPGSMRKRVRFNAHAGPGEAVHEMIIALARDTYIPPHKHFGKSESFHIIEGNVDIVIFDDDGGIRQIVRLGDARSGKTFFYRTSEPYFHAVVAQSDVVIFHETTNGPFVKEASVTATWAPAVEGPEAVSYLSALRKTIASQVT